MGMRVREGSPAVTQECSQTRPNAEGGKLSPSRQQQTPGSRRRSQRQKNSLTPRTWRLAGQAAARTSGCPTSWEANLTPVEESERSSCAFMRSTSSLQQVGSWWVGGSQPQQLVSVEPQQH